MAHSYDQDHGHTARGGMQHGMKHRRKRPWLISPEEFRELRHSCFMSRATCAAFLGLSPATIRAWETGRSRANWAAIHVLRPYRLGTWARSTTTGTAGRSTGWGCTHQMATPSTTGRCNCGGSPSSKHGSGARATKRKSANSYSCSNDSIAPLTENRSATLKNLHISLNASLSRDAHDR